MKKYNKHYNLTYDKSTGYWKKHINGKVYLFNRSSTKSDYAAYQLAMDRYVRFIDVINTSNESLSHEDKKKILEHIRTGEEGLQIFISHMKEKEREKIVSLRRNIAHKRWYSARRRGLPFDITVDDIYEKITEHCPILGFKYVFDGSNKNRSPSLDRIDSSKGYTKDNIQVISWKANALKSNSTPEERKMLHEYDKSYEERCVIQPAFTFKSFLDSIDSILQENAHP